MSVSCWSGWAGVLVSVCCIRCVIVYLCVCDGIVRGVVCVVCVYKFVEFCVLSILVVGDANLAC